MAEEKTSLPTIMQIDSASRGDLLPSAQRAIATEHAASFRTLLLQHRKAVAWSLAFSTCIIMEAYDTMLVGNLFAQPEFKAHYGTKNSKGKYQIPAPWQSGLTNGAGCGQLIGLLLAGYTSEWIGLKRTVLLGLASTVGIIFIQVFSPSLGVLEAGQVLFGIPLGMLQVTPVVYAMEVLPMGLRAYLTNYVNLCWAIGHLLGAGILRGTLQVSGQWSFRMAFALQWFWPLILIPLLWFAPESPWWLVRKGRLEESKEQQRRLICSDHPDLAEYIDQQTDLMVLTTEHERQLNSRTSYIACFSGNDLKRTLIVIGIYVTQTMSGNPLRGYSTYFLNQAGLATTQAFNMTIANYAVALVGGIVSWALLPIMGRRTNYISSLAMMFVLLLVIGGLGIPTITPNNTAYAWAIGSILIVSSFLYNTSMGPLTNTLCVEIPSTLLRNKSIALARWCYAVSTIVAGTVTPYQLNPTAWNWGAKTGFFWAGTCAISTICAYFFVPETKDRTSAEMDLLFARNISARHSAKAQVAVSELVVSPKSF